MLALVIVVIIAVPYITAAAISAATLGGTLLVASTAAAPEIMFTCFGGGDESHWLQVKAQLQVLASCHSCLAKAVAGQCKK